MVNGCLTTAIRGRARFEVRDEGRAVCKAVMRGGLPGQTAGDVVVGPVDARLRGAEHDDASTID